MIHISVSNLKQTRPFSCAGVNTKFTPHTHIQTIIVSVVLCFKPWPLALRKEHGAEETLDMRKNKYQDTEENCVTAFINCPSRQT